VKNTVIWGNHSGTQFPDVSHATIDGKPAADVLKDESWIKNDFVKTVQQRGAAVIKARGNSSAFSAANAIVDHVRDWELGTKNGEYVSMAVFGNGAYGITDEIIYSFPVTISGGKWKIVEGLSISDFAREKMEATRKELVEERTMAFEITGIKQ